MEALRLFKSLSRVQRNTFIACFLGWTLDALDFFLLTFVFVPVAHDFGRTIPEVTFAITITLMMRPLGAFIFGWLGDRFGRRLPLMIDIVFYSVIELLTAFAPNFATFLLLRAMFGIGMGGEWGLGASLAMESLPTPARGLFSGILQQGYAFGYLLAALVYWIVFPIFGWRGLFVAGALPALLVIYIRAHVPESPVWERNRAAAKGPTFNLRQTHEIRSKALRQRTWGVTNLRGPAHDRIQLHVARNSGSLLDFSRKTARLRRQRDIDDHHGLCHRHDLWRHRHRLSFATMGPSPVHYFVGDLRDAFDSGVDFLARDAAPDCRRFSHAIHGARRVGSGAGTFERTFAG
jgi:hypothetical protein